MGVGGWGLGVGGWGFRVYHRPAPPERQPSEHDPPEERQGWLEAEEGEELEGSAREGVGRSGWRYPQLGE